MMQNTGWLIPLGVSLLSAISVVVSPANADTIKRFDSTIRVDKNASLDIREELTVDFGKNKRHGIVRTISETAEILSKNYRIYIDSVSTLCDGKQVACAKSDASDVLTLKVGDAANELSGVHKFAVAYHVKGAVHMSNGRPEIYWNITGSQWKQTIEEANAALVPPESVTPAQLKTASFVGVKGSKTPASIKHSANEVDFTTHNLQPGQGMTIAVQLPADSVKIPGAIAEHTWWLMQGGLGLLAIGATLLGLWPLGLVLLILLVVLHFGFQSTEWGSNGESSTDFGSADGGFGGGGGDTW